MFASRFVPLALLALSSVSFAAGGFEPIRLDYTVTPEMGSYRYDFTLSLTDTPNGTTGYGWIIFGDAPFGSTGPINDFVGTPGSIVAGPGSQWLDFNTGMPTSPISYFTTTGGGHNGPTLGYVLDTWVPTLASDTLTWSGYSSVSVPTMKWSAISSRDFALDDPLTLPYEGFKDIQFYDANPVPEPASMAALALGAGALLRRRRN